MTRPSPEERIGAFFEAREQEVSSQQYLRFDPDGPFIYVFSPDSTGVSLLVDRLRGAGLKRRVASTAFSGGKLVPGGLRVLPGVSSTTVRTPSDAAFGLVIASDRQLTLLAPRDRIAATIGWPGESRVTEEINIRNQIPRSINVPDLVEYDKEFPHFQVKYIEGTAIQNPVSEWEYILSALEQLRVWYQKNEIKWIDTTIAISNLREDLRPLSNKPIVSDSFEMLEQLSMPNQLAWGITHGDIHGENLRISNGDVYILDWERAGERYLHSDFFLPFLYWTQRGGDNSIFKDLLDQTGKASRITGKYAQRLGPPVWDSTDWPSGIVVFALLRELVVRSRGATGWNQAYEVISKL